MQTAIARRRMIAVLVAAAVLSTGCAANPLTSAVPAAAPTAAAQSNGPGSGADAMVPPRVTVPAASDEMEGDGEDEEEDDPADLSAGDLYVDPVTGREMIIEADITHTAVLIGDSQSGGAAGVSGKQTWTNSALQKLGFHVRFGGRGGTGFVTETATTGNYPDALEDGDWDLSYGPAPLVVIQGGGNDASRGATDAQILTNAARLLRDLKQMYPKARFVMIGTLAKGAKYGGGRRTEVDTLLGRFAAKNSISFVSVGDWITRYRLTHKMADGVHLTAAGHRVLSEVLAQVLLRLGVHAPTQAAARTAPDPSRFR